MRSGPTLSDDGDEQAAPVGLFGYGHLRPHAGRPFLSAAVAVWRLQVLRTALEGTRARGAR